MNLQDALHAEMAELTARLARAEQKQQQAEQKMERAARRSRRQGICALAAVVGMGLMTIRPMALAQTPGVTLASLQAAISALQQKTAALTQTGTPGMAGALLQVKGDNVQIVSGSGSTDDNGKLTGLGNLIIGYNAGRGQSGTDTRTGSHNLILGDQNNYSSFGGLAAGYFNTISNQYASVSGGFDNTASGSYSSVSGGLSNAANGLFSSVSGGQSNTAGSQSTSVSGGNNNMASGAFSSVSGGQYNTAGGSTSSVGGGQYNMASGGDSVISAGNGLTQTNTFGWSAGSYHSP